jgi:hypothetical protein
MENGEWETPAIHPILHFPLPIRHSPLTHKHSSGYGSVERLGAAITRNCYELIDHRAHGRSHTVAFAADYDG